MLGPILNIFIRNFFFLFRRRIKFFIRVFIRIILRELNFIVKTRSKRRKDIALNLRKHFEFVIIFFRNLLRYVIVILSFYYEIVVFRVNSIEFEVTIEILRHKDSVIFKLTVL